MYAVVYSWVALSQIEFELAILCFMGSILKGQNCSDQWITKKTRGFSLLGLADTITGLELSSELLTVTWGYLTQLINRSETTIKYILTNMSLLITSIENLHVKPILNQTANRNLTYVSNITLAMSSIGSFPWAGLMKIYPILDKELHFGSNSYSK